MQFYSLMFLSIVGIAMALPQDQTAKQAEARDTLERRVSPVTNIWATTGLKTLCFLRLTIFQCAGQFGYCASDADCCSGYVCYIKGSSCV